MFQEVLVCTRKLQIVSEWNISCEFEKLTFAQLMCGKEMLQQCSVCVKHRLAFRAVRKPVLVAMRAGHEMSSEELGFLEYDLVVDAFGVKGLLGAVASMASRGTGRIHCVRCCYEHEVGVVGVECVVGSVWCFGL